MFVVDGCWQHLDIACSSTGAYRYMLRTCTAIPGKQGPDSSVQAGLLVDSLATYWPGWSRHDLPSIAGYLNSVSVSQWEACLSGFPQSGLYGLG